MDHEYDTQTDCLFIWHNWHLERDRFGSIIPNFVNDLLDIIMLDAPICMHFQSVVVDLKKL
jgi:hypothetical protein